MATQGQAYYFLWCVLVGFAGGLPWQILSLPKFFFYKKRAKRIVEIVVDILFFVFFGLSCSLLSARFGLPSPRGYMYAGYALGLIIYSKTIKILLDFLENVCYNTITKLLKRAKSRLKKEEKV